MPKKWERYKGVRPEPLGFPARSVLALGGHRIWSRADFDAYFALCGSLKISADALFVLMRHEAGLDPTAWNGKAAGLVQITTAAKTPGFDTAAKVKGIIHMTIPEQLKGPVRVRLLQGGPLLAGLTPGELILWNFTPSYFGKPEATVISRKGETIYDGNYKAFDPEGKGHFTVGDVYRQAERICSEAHGRRVMADGRVINADGSVVAPSAPAAAKPAPASHRAPASRRGPASHRAPASKPAPTAPPPAAAESPAEEAPAPLPYGAAAFTSMRNSPDASAGPVRSEFTAKASAPPTSPAPAKSDEDSNPLGAVQKSAQSSDSGSGSGSGSGVMGAISEAATSLAGLFSSGGVDLAPETNVRGILLTAVEHDATEPVQWAWVQVESDLEVLVMTDALRCTLGTTPRVRVPVSWDEHRRICRQLAIMPPTREWVDAIHQAASVSPVSVGLVRDGHPEDQKLMNSVGFVLRYHEQLERQLADLGATEDTLIEPVGKWWIFSGRMANRVGKPGTKVNGLPQYGVNGASGLYGFFDAKGHPMQPDSAVHDANHNDYAMVCRGISQWGRRPGTRPGTYEDVYLPELLEQRMPAIAESIALFRSQ